MLTPPVPVLKAPPVCSLGSRPFGPRVRPAAPKLPAPSARPRPSPTTIWRRAAKASMRTRPRPGRQEVESSVAASRGWRGRKSCSRLTFFSRRTNTLDAGFPDNSSAKGTARSTRRGPGRVPRLQRADALTGTGPDSRRGRFQIMGFNHTRPATPT